MIGERKNARPAGSQGGRAFRRWRGAYGRVLEDPLVPPVPMPLELEPAPLERRRCMQSSRALPVRALQADVSDPMREELELAAPVPP
jgi:hypothetical protein